MNCVIGTHSVAKQARKYGIQEGVFCAERWYNLNIAERRIVYII